VQLVDQQLDQQPLVMIMVLGEWSFGYYLGEIRHDVPLTMH
jgi:hypothetical protein